MGVAMENLGLPVARHLAMGERRIAGLLQEDYLIQEALSGYKDFDRWFAENFEGKLHGRPVLERRHAINRLAALIRRMHDQGVLQRDLKPDQIVVGPE